MGNCCTADVTYDDFGSAAKPAMDATFESPRAREPGGSVTCNKMVVTGTNGCCLPTHFDGGEHEQEDVDGLRKFEKRRPPPIRTDFSKK
mmetsp:Transcript_117748/g.205023  ORF Transcript_117748/g.205023 Transcript_117748/m.205023 type:complete len:89 (-) Transcript_117748:390-656(-)